MTALPLIAVNLAIAAGLFLVLWLAALRLKDASFVDAFWAFGMVVLALSSFALADGDLARQALLTGLCALWGLRLGLHLFLRWRRDGVDRRYAALFKRVKEGRNIDFPAASLMFVFLPQAVLMWLVSLPVQLGQAAAAPPLGALAAIGALLAVTGIVFETVGDTQLSRFRADPANKGKVLDTGLWRYTRHPNYFGDACVWWGLYLIAAETAPGVWAVFGPLFLTWTLLRWSGAPLLERNLRETRPAYADYVRRTSGFIPWPPGKD